MLQNAAALVAFCIINVVSSVAQETATQKLLYLSDEPQDYCSSRPHLLLLLLPLCSQMNLEKERIRDAATVCFPTLDPPTIPFLWLGDKHHPARKMMNSAASAALHHWRSSECFP